MPNSNNFRPPVSDFITSIDKCCEPCSPLLNGFSRDSTLGHIGATQLNSICEHFKVPNGVRTAAVRSFLHSTVEWANWPATTRWNNDVTDDDIPYEFSIAISPCNSPVVRFLVEPQMGPCTLQSNWAAGQSLMKTLETQNNIDTSKFSYVEDIFAPTASSAASFAFWISIVVGDPLQAKCYLNPNIQGTKKCVPTVKEAFLRLGVPLAWNFVQKLLEKIDDTPRIIFFALDLSSSPDARVKMYMTLNSVSSALQLGLIDLQENDLTRFLGTRGEYLNKRPIVLCLAFDSQSTAEVPSVTLHIPTRCYMKNTQAVLQVLSGHLQLADSQLLNTLFSSNVINCGNEHISYTSFGIGNIRGRWNCYIPPGKLKSEYPRTPYTAGLHATSPFILNPYKTKIVEPIKLSSKVERISWIQDAKYNLINLNSDHICLDFLTDSGTGAMSAKQTACLITGDETYAGSSSFHRFQKAVRKFTGFQHILPVHQGRAAERILFKALVRPGDIVPNNSHFDTTRGNILLAGGTPVDLPVQETTNGNMDCNGLRNLLQKNPEKIPFVLLTVTNNATGGQPVSMENIRGVREICDEFGKRLYIDSARIAENAMFIKKQALGYGNKLVSSIVREILSYADGMTMSAKKDGLTHVGGWIALNDAELAAELEVNLTVTEGFRTYGGLAGRDLDAIAQGLEEVVDESYLEHRIGAVAALGRMLEEIGVPVVQPTGGHAVYVDAKKIVPGIPSANFPAHALAVALYIGSGIRTGGMGSFFHGDNYTGDELLRIAIPRRVYSENHFQYVQISFKELMAGRNEIKGFKVVKERKLMRHFNAELEFTMSEK